MSWRPFSISLSWTLRCRLISSGVWNCAGRPVSILPRFVSGRRQQDDIDFLRDDARRGSGRLARGADAPAAPGAYFFPRCRCASTPCRATTRWSSRSRRTIPGAGSRRASAAATMEVDEAGDASWTPAKVEARAPSFFAAAGGAYWFFVLLAISSRHRRVLRVEIDRPPPLPSRCRRRRWRACSRCAAGRGVSTCCGDRCARFSRRETSGSMRIRSCTIWPGRVPPTADGPSISSTRRRITS